MLLIQIDVGEWKTAICRESIFLSVISSVDGNSWATLNQNAISQALVITI